MHLYRMNAYTVSGTVFGLENTKIKELAFFEGISKGALRRKLHDKVVSTLIKLKC